MGTAMPAATRATGIWDNHRRGKIGDYLRARIHEGTDLSFVSAFFTIYAYAALKKELDVIERLRFLFGEPSFVQSLDPEKTQKKAFRIEDDQLAIANRLQQKRIARECADWIQAKVEIRSIKQAGFLHGKMYHVANGGVQEAIIGSSNFTVRGLGLGQTGNNIELNLEVNDNRDRNDLKAWFDELWSDAALVEDVKADVLRYLEQLYQNHAPEFVYYKTLFHIFEKFMEEERGRDAQLDRTTLLETKVWKTLFEFQKDGVKGAINKILKHNGCIIADSVGLGKTYEALAIIKYFELRNSRVLVLCPKKLSGNWTVYRNNDALNPFIEDRFAYDVLCHTDLSRDTGTSGVINLETVNWGNYDFVVIDESHNFRNNTRGKRNEDGTIIRKSRYERLMDDIIKGGVKTKVLLLTATPVNNDLKDLRNQLYFLTEGRDDAFKETMGIRSLKDTLGGAQNQFTRWAKEPTAKRKTADLLERLSGALFKLLDELTIARSRKHVQRYYKESVTALGGFPERLKPLSIYPEIDLQRKFLSYDRLNDEISQYQLSLFNPSKYVKDEFQQLYMDQRVFAFTQDVREFFLIGMMKVNFLKRLESSVESFEITLKRTIEKIEELMGRIKRFKAAGKKGDEVDLDELKLEGLDQDEDEAFEVGTKLRFKLEHLDVTKWLKDLERDRQQLHLLYLAAENVTVERDAKLAELKRLIAAKVKKPTTNKFGKPNRKVLVFTAFADTADYLYGAIRDWALNDLGIQVALVSGGATENKTTFGKNDYNHILTNFCPVSKHRDKIPFMPQEGEIDLLIATDCISEGQNLQDCDYLVNYDIHWNPVRIIQRFGRIDRIGSTNRTVQLVNFWPTHDLNKYINLKNRVEARMALVDIAATFEENILKTDDLQDLVGDELRYRDKQLLRLKDEVLDLEDFAETITLNEFTLDDFRIELSKYLEANRKLLEEAPFGLYAVVPTNPDYPVIAPGVVFCLKQKGDAHKTEGVNPLQPYFLAYVHEDGNVRFSFTQAKQILEILRLLCAGKATAYEDLCNAFDQETSNGGDMKQYSRLLTAAVSGITATFRRRMASGLQTGRDFVIPDKKQQVADTEDFELVTWLVIKERK